MTKPNKHGRSLKTARRLARRKYKERLKRRHARKYALRIGQTPEQV